MLLFLKKQVSGKYKIIKRKKNIFPFIVLIGYFSIGDCFATDSTLVPIPPPSPYYIPNGGIVTWGNSTGYSAYTAGPNNNIFTTSVDIGTFPNCEPGSSPHVIMAANDVELNSFSTSSDSYRLSKFKIVFNSLTTTMITSSTSDYNLSYTINVVTSENTTNAKVGASWILFCSNANNNGW
jgi:hypothetical protein